MAFAICNLVVFVEARPIEFDFNSNLVNVINHSPASNTGNTCKIVFQAPLYFLIGKNEENNQDFMYLKPRHASSVVSKSIYNFVFKIQ